MSVLFVTIIVLLQLNFHLNLYLLSSIQLDWSFSYT